jgi:predicted transcriptional regulator
MKHRPPALATVGIVSDRLGQPLHRIQYILRSRPHIQPTATAGRLRLFDEQSVQRIEAELRKIDRRGANHG